MKHAFAILLACVMLLTGLALAEPAVIACVGDSLTYGVKPNTMGEQSENAYPTVLNALLGEDYEVQNYGKPGSTLTEKGVCYRNRDVYQESLDAAADMVIIMLGTNDANVECEWDAALFESDLNDMVDAYRAARADTIVYLMAPPAVFMESASGAFVMDADLLRGELRDIVSRVASEKGTGYIDLFAATEAHPEWMGGDGVHFLDEGYLQVANVVYEGIREDAAKLIG